MSSPEQLRGTYRWQQLRKSLISRGVGVRDLR